MPKRHKPLGMSGPAVFQKLQAWQDRENYTDTKLAEKIGVHQTAISRAKRGLRVLGIEHQLALQKITGIPPAEWADWFAQTVHLRPKTSGAAQKKSPRLSVAAEPEPAQ